MEDKGKKYNESMGDKEGQAAGRNWCWHIEERGKIKGFGLRSKKGECWTKEPNGGGRKI